jgi:hypothetical protein
VKRGLLLSLLGSNLQFSNGFLVLPSSGGSSITSVRRGTLTEAAASVNGGATYSEILTEKNSLSHANETDSAVSDNDYGITLFTLV